ncbi:MAG: lysophospholipase [Clostridia bacterium]|nr:lysophospholipase [Clostridia bacterium]
MDESVFFLSKEEKVARYRELNRTAFPGQTVFAGSSLMEMFPVEELVAETHPEKTVYNRGISGYVTDELMAVLDVCILDLKPSKLFINIGTNDLSNPDVTVPSLMEKYDRLLTRVQEALPDLQLFLLAYYPINELAAPDDEMRRVLSIRTNARLDEANEAVQVLASKHGATYLDLNAPLRDKTGRLKAEWTYEGMHIKEEGYRAIFPLLEPYL